MSLSSYFNVKRIKISSILLLFIFHSTFNLAKSSTLVLSHFESEIISIAFIAPADLCENDGVQNGLGGGTPVGGIYSGPGVTDDGNGMTYSFNPMSAGVGNHTLMYTVDGNTFSDDINVFSSPIVTINGPSMICIGETTDLFPSFGGVWESSDPSIAAVTNSGIATAISPGVVTFIYTDSGTGCSAETESLVVSPTPAVNIAGTNELCIGENTNLLPSTGGIWYSQNPSIATVTNNGVVTALSAGSTIFVFTDIASGCTASTDPVIINEVPAVLLPSNMLCIGETVNLIPSSGGTWYSQDANVASVNNSGLVTALSGGTTTFTYTDNSSGCSAETETLIVEFPPVVSITGSDEICPGETTSLSPNSGGIWQSLDPSVAIVTNSGTVTGVSGGTTTFQFTDSNTGCSTETETLIVNINPNVSISGPSEICVGEMTNALPASGGFWSSEFNYIASISNDGTITGNFGGSVSFLFTDANTQCSAMTESIVVHPEPLITITGPTDLCVGGSTTLVSVSSGTWSSQYPSIATITNSGVVTAIDAGAVLFEFTDSNTGCSVLSEYIIVSPDPEVEFSGQTQICVGETTTLIPSSGGIWISLDPSIATVSNNGEVVGISNGTTTFIFTDNNTQCSSESESLIVNSSPTVTISGPDQICIDETTNLMPSSGGTWQSQNPNIATVTNDGTVVGISAGITSFVFTENGAGCSSETDLLTIHSDPVLEISGDDEICIGETTNLLPTTGGTWQSQNPNIATVTNDGLVTAIAAGTTIFIYTNSNTGCSGETQLLVVNNGPVVSISGASEICVGETSMVFPSSGGTWVSQDENIATVSNSGIVTGVSSGSTSFIFIDNNTGCSSETNLLSVIALPIVDISGPSNLCIGETTNLLPSIGGTWQSIDPSVATVDNSGVVTGLSPGTTGFIFTDISTGCSSESEAVIVNPKPVTAITGSDEICIGETTTLSPSSGGTWQSLEPFTATVNNSGLVTGIQSGIVTFTFTEASTGCISESSEPITVNPNPEAYISGDYEICVGETTTLAPSSGGTWESQNESIAEVTNEGIVTSLNDGGVSFIFTDSNTGCSAETGNVDIYPLPLVYVAGPGAICVGETSNLWPTSGGTWESLFPNLATVDNTGLVTGISQGGALFVFTEDFNGCSNEPIQIIIDPIPDVVFSGPDEVCVGETTNLLPSTGGTWFSSDSNIATISNSGLVTSLSAGIVSFTYINNVTSCSATSESLIVNANPVVSFAGPDEILEGETTNVLPATGGTWQSSDESIASVTNAGFITGISEGTASFIFTESNSSCSAETEILIVNAAPFVFMGSDGNWDTPSNWEGGVVPTAPIQDEVILSADVTYGMPNGIALSNGGSITINEGVVFSVNSEVNVDGGGILINLGTLIIMGE